MCTKQTIHYVDWWYKNVEKIFRKKICKYIYIYSVHCNSLEPCVSRFAAATAGILANRSHTQCILWGIWTVKPSANSTGTQHHGGGERERERQGMMTWSDLDDGARGGGRFRIEFTGTNYYPKKFLLHKAFIQAHWTWEIRQCPLRNWKTDDSVS